MITASHLPYNRNGFKFFTAEGSFEKGDIAAVLDAASHHSSGNGNDAGGKTLDAELDAAKVQEALGGDVALLSEVTLHLEYGDTTSVFYIVSQHPYFVPSQPGAESGANTTYTWCSVQNSSDVSDNLLALLGPLGTDTDAYLLHVIIYC